jgi:hypothetical protein
MFSAYEGQAGVLLSTSQVPFQFSKGVLPKTSSNNKIPNIQKSTLLSEAIPNPIEDIFESMSSSESKALFSNRTLCPGPRFMVSYLSWLFYPKGYSGIV